MSKLLCRLKNSTFLLLLLYFILLSFMFGVAMYLYTTDDVDVYDSKDMISDFEFYTANNELVDDTFQLCEYSDNPYIYTIIPNDLQKGFDFCFESKHMNVAVYIDDQLVYESPNNIENFYTKSNGFRYITIPLESSDRGKTIKLEYNLLYKDDINSGIYKAVYTSSGNYIVSAFNKDMFAFCLSLYSIIYGAILIVLNFVFYKSLKYERDFRYLGFLLLTVGLYSMFDVRSLYLVFNNSQLIHLMKCMSLILMPSAMILCASNIFKGKHKFACVVFSIYNTVTFIVITILNYTNIADYHMLVVWPIFNMSLALIFMAYALRYKFKGLSGRTFKLSNLTFDHKLLFIGCAFDIVLVIIDMFYYDVPGTVDNTKYTRYGFFILSVCFSIVSVKKFIESVKLKTRMAVISNLAYKDGLTDLYNRMSYNEDLERFEREQHPVGIVMLDVNNLKHVNDTFGHDEGDDMLLECAKILKRSYNKPNMKVYRIGGDEFVVIIDSEDCLCDYDYCDDRMKRLYQAFNINTDRRFKLVISSGFCQYSSDNYSSIEDAVKNADSKMYECKKQLKQYKYFNVMV